MLSKEIAKPFSNAITTFFSRPCVVKSIPSWTITQIVQGVVSAREGTRESMSLVLVSLIMHVGAAKGFVHDSTG
jgi:DNA-directed RNA polymerase-5 subunit 1